MSNFPTVPSTPFDTKELSTFLAALNLALESREACFEFDFRVNPGPNVILNLEGVDTTGWAGPEINTPRGCAKVALRYAKWRMGE